MKKISKRIIDDIKKFLPIIMVIGIMWVVIDYFWGAVCPSMLIAGLPCPGCGMTRALFCIFTGKWQQALWYNPMSFFWLMGGSYYLLMRYVGNKKAKGIVVYFMVVMITTILVFGIRMYLHFPGPEPLCYHSGNLIEKYIPLY